MRRALARYTPLHMYTYVLLYARYVVSTSRFDNLGGLMDENWVEEGGGGDRLSQVKRFCCAVLFCVR